MDVLEILRCPQTGNKLRFGDGGAVVCVDGCDVRYAVVDGILTVVTGEADITSLEYDVTLNTISSSTGRLEIRDMFGTEAVLDGKNLKEGNNISYRPLTINDPHRYNLRNQTWAEPRCQTAIRAVSRTLIAG